MPPEDLKRQRWKFYVVAVAWPVFVLGLPWVFHHSLLLALALMIFPGGYLFAWAGLLMHEAWHRYVPDVPNGIFYNYFSWILLTDPQVRNLRADGLCEKIFLFLTHGDAREHVLHHTLVSVYSRPFPGKIPMPPDPVYITLKDYLKILLGMLAKDS